MHTDVLFGITFLPHALALTNAAEHPVEGGLLEQMGHLSLPSSSLDLSAFLFASSPRSGTASVRFLHLLSLRFGPVELRRGRRLESVASA